ncbi:ABC transporter permease subunit [Nocardioides sp. MAHUQ-72]|uniref:ABC transporter permease subunit n=1 Tax=unclassified Nocardioides TaxID=2615069 RepID=UPI003618C0E1
MSGQTLAPTALPTLDVSGTPAIPFSRLVRVESRKMADTRAGRWLLISIAALTALVLVIQLAVVLTQDLAVDFSDFLIAMNTPMGVLLPVLGIMSITSEWSQRTAMVTFSLEPSRARLVAAKFVSTLLIALAAVVVGLLLGVVANLAYGALSGDTVVWEVTALQMFSYFLLHVFGMATGFAFGMLFLNTAAGIVVYFVYSFVLPGLFQLGASLMGWFGDLQPWIDFNAAQNALVQGDPSGSDWGHLVVSGLLWLVLPLAVGVWRVLRAEVK